MILYILIFGVLHLFPLRGDLDILSYLHMIFLDILRFICFTIGLNLCLFSKHFIKLLKHSSIASSKSFDQIMLKNIMTNLSYPFSTVMVPFLSGLVLTLLNKMVVQNENIVTFLMLFAPFSFLPLFLSVFGVRPHSLLCTPLIIFLHQLHTTNRHSSFSMVKPLTTPLYG